MLLRSLRKRDDTIAREATTYEAHEWFAMGGGSPYLGTDRGALSIPAFYRGLRLKNDVVSTMPLVPVLNRQRLEDMPPILWQPDPTEDRQTTVSRMVNSINLRGEIVAVLGDWDAFGYPNALKVVDPLQASLNPNGSWTIASKTYSRSEVLHVLVFALPGQTRGCSVVELGRRVLEGEVNAAEFQRSFYRDGAQPNIVVTINRPGITPEQIGQFKVGWMHKLRGRREPIVLPGDIKAEPMALTNRDAQFLEGRQFALVDIAHLIGVPPYYLGAPGATMTYSNVNDERRNLLDLYLRADIYGIERGFSSLLPDVLDAEFNTDTFLRLDPKGTAEVMQLEATWRTIDELRALKNLPPLPNGEGKVLASAYQPRAVEAQAIVPALAEGGDQ